MLNIPFLPAGAYGATPNAAGSVSATTSVQQITLPKVFDVQTSMRIVVRGTANIAWSYGTSPNLSMSNGVVMLGNTVEVFSLPAEQDTISVIGDATGSTVYIYVGDGE